MYNNAINSEGLPVSLFNTPLGYVATELYYNKYKEAVQVKPEQQNKVEVTGENTLENAAAILQLWQNLDNWANYWPESVTQIVKRLTEILYKLRRATPTDAPYDFYELVLFWNIAAYPEKFAPVIFTDSVYNILVTNANEYTYEIMYTTLQNMIIRAKDTNAPIVQVNEVYNEYEIPPAPPLVTTTPPTQNAQNVPSWWLLIGVIFLGLYKFFKR